LTHDKSKAQMIFETDQVNFLISSNPHYLRLQILSNSSPLFTTLDSVLIIKIINSILFICLHKSFNTLV